jgi:signal peptidase II
MIKPSRNFLILILLVATIGCDQISKIIVRHEIAGGSRISVIGDLVTMTKVENTGAFLSLGNNIPRFLYWILMIILPLVVMGYGLYYLLTEKKLSIPASIGISLIVGGGIGNLIDRIIYGSVTDFLYFDFIIFHTGIVNLADISITAGFFILLYYFYMERYRTKRQVEK